MEDRKATCSVCGRSFEIRFRFQAKEEGGHETHFCSVPCQQEALAAACECSVCGASFALEYPHQVMLSAGQKLYFCGMGCRRLSQAATRTAVSSTRRIAVFNHKGGTAKTTTSVNVAAGLAERGARVLLIDADAQGNVGASLGIRGEMNLYHVLVMGTPVRDAAIPVRQNLDVLTSNELLAAAELYLAGRANRHRLLCDRVAAATNAYDYVIIDCAPALSVMNQNALVYADSVLVPVSCDYLSLVGVRQVLRTLKNVREILKHDVRLLGALPTFFDVRNKICREAVAALEDYFGERCLSPIRVNTKLREAPSVKQTIFEYAPDCHGALDYMGLVERLVAPGVDAAHFPSDKEATNRLWDRHATA